MKPRTSALFSNLFLAAYALLLAPFVAEWLRPGETNAVIGILGLGLYAGEYAAFRIKLRMIRIRTELRRRAQEKSSGEKIAQPAANGLLVYGFLMRMCYRVTLVIFSLMAFGISTDNGKTLPVPVLLLVCAVVLFEVFSLVLIISSGLFGGAGRTKRQLDRDRLRNDTWLRQQLPLAESENYRHEEMFADLLLQVYTYVAFTAVWDALNKAGVSFVEEAGKAHEQAGTTAGIILFMMAVMAVLFLLPMRLPYWLERFAAVYTPKQRWLVRGSFVLAVVAACVPVITAYVRAFF